MLKVEFAMNELKLQYVSDNFSPLHGYSYMAGFISFAGGIKVTDPNGITFCPYKTNAGQYLEGYSNRCFVITDKSQQFCMTSKRLCTTFHFVEVRKDESES